VAASQAHAKDLTFPDRCPSAQEEPRAGLGNLAQDLGSSVGEVGAFLASVDGLGATHCP
jgi:hypothetical protein